MKITTKWFLTAAKIASMAFVAISLFAAALFGLFLPRVENHFLEQRRQAVRLLLDPVWSTMQKKQEAVVEGRLSLEEAQDSLMEHLRHIRYGNKVDGYFWIQDTTPRILMHPIRSDLEGNDIKELRDARGNSLLERFVDATQNPENGGFVSYDWFANDDTNHIKTKLSFVRRFEPWDWIIGTGIFVDDIERDLADLRRVLLTAILVIFTITISGVGMLAWFASMMHARAARQEDRARRNEQRFQALFDLLPFACIITSLDGNIILANRHYCNTIGASNEAIAGKTLQMLHRNVDQESQRELHEKGRIDAREIEVVTPEGVQTLIISSCMIDWQEHQAILTATVDVTTQKNMERQAEENRLFTDALIEQSPAYVVVLAENLGIVRVNQAFCKATGHDNPDILIGANYIQTFIPDSFRERISKSYRQQFDAYRQTGSHMWTSENPIRTRSGDQRQIHWSGCVLHIPNTTEIVLLAVGLDLTEQFTLQAQINHMQKMESIGQLAGGIAHDFNNMLGGIIAATELTQMLLDENEDPREYLQLILDSAERAAALTSKLLAFARKQPLASTAIDAIQPLRDALALLGNTIDKRITIQTNLPQNALQVIGDPAQLQNAYMNILMNATHAMPDGGSIFISARTVELDDEYCRACTSQITPGMFTDIEIRDTGSGIPEESLSRIFEPFFTTKPQGKGTGLGLSAVLGTVQQHQGSVSVYSEVGTGTSFHILLPLSEEVRTETQTRVQEKDKGSGTILLVDDEQIMRTTASAILRDLGYDVLLAADGEEGLDMFKKHASSIDLVILDMIMPRMNGRDCFLAMKAVKPDVRVLLCSGFSRDDEVHMIKKNGLRGFIPKPFRSNALSRAVRDALA